LQVFTYRPDHSSQADADALVNAALFGGEQVGAAAGASLSATVTFHSNSRQPDSGGGGGGGGVSEAGTIVRGRFF
jgi:hypothetical protein